MDRLAQAAKAHDIAVRVLSILGWSEFEIMMGVVQGALLFRAEIIFTTRDLFGRRLHQVELDARMIDQLQTMYAADRED